MPASLRGLHKASLSPANLAIELTGGRWQLAAHLALVNRALLHVAAGTTRRLLITMPPRHGKSEMASHWFPTWFLGQCPDRNVILASYEATFAESWGRKVRDSLAEAGARGIFPGVNIRADSSSASRWEIARHGGGMVTAGAGGAITGRGANLFVVDDPVKNAEEANSPTYRERVWDWWRSTALTRLEPNGVVVGMMTRWHQDDWGGRALRGTEEDAEPWQLLSLPAFAEEEDVLGREPGESLWPERFSRAELEAQRAALGGYWWSAMYQQRPVPREGGTFKAEWLPFADEVPRQARRVRYWDRAATAGGGDFTVGVLLAAHPNGTYTVLDVRRGQWSSARCEDEILAAAREDGHETAIIMEQEPGAAGKDLIASYVRLLAGWNFRGEPSRGTKEFRADPFAAQCEAGNVRLARASWADEFIEELCSFPRGNHDDQVDASSGAFAWLAKMAGGDGSVKAWSGDGGEAEEYMRRRKTTIFEG